MITIWSCTHHTHLFRPTCLIINTCDQNWREMQNFHLRMQRLLLDCCELVDRCGCFCSRRGSLWGRCGVVVGSLWGRSGSLWIVVGRCGVVVGSCGSLWVVPCFSNYDYRMVKLLYEIHNQLQCALFHFTFLISRLLYCLKYFGKPLAGELISTSLAFQSWRRSFENGSYL